MTIFDTPEGYVVERNGNNLLLKSLKPKTSAIIRTYFNARGTGNFTNEAMAYTDSSYVSSNDTVEFIIPEYKLTSQKVRAYKTIWDNGHCDEYSEETHILK